MLEARVTEQGRLRRVVPRCPAWPSLWMRMAVLLPRWGALEEEQATLGNKCSTASEDIGMIWRGEEEKGARFEKLILSQS